MRGRDKATHVERRRLGVGLICVLDDFNTVGRPAHAVTALCNDDIGRNFVLGQQRPFGAAEVALLLRRKHGLRAIADVGEFVREQVFTTSAIQCMAQVLNDSGLPRSAPTDERRQGSVDRYFDVLKEVRASDA